MIEDRPKPETYLPLGLIDVDRDWMDDAYCRVNKIELNKFYPERGGNQGYGNQSAKETVCRKCPVVKECLNYALNNNISIGIYGGTSGRERRVLQRERRG